jgi:hypothetical protein
MRKKMLSSVEVLRYRETRRSPSTIRRHYRAWRRKMNLPDRCDNPDCTFYDNPLVWNGKKLPPVLDHKNGNRKDNTPDNLQYLCPNCESQLPTRGGANKGRLEKQGPQGYTMRNRDGTREHVIYGGVDVRARVDGQPTFTPVTTAKQTGKVPKSSLEGVPAGTRTRK